MARRRRRRGRRRGGGRRSKVASHGGLLRGRVHPPTNSASPWNTYVLTLTWKEADTAKGITCIGRKSFMEQLRTELGLAKAQQVSLRVMRMDVWTPPPSANSDRNFIVFAPSDWTDMSKCDAARSLNWYESWGTAVQPAHLHYVWPRSISNIVINDDDTVICRFDIKEKCSYIIKLHCMWRPLVPDPRPTYAVGLRSVRTMRQTTATQDDEFEDVEELIGGLAGASV